MTILTYIGFGTGIVGLIGVVATIAAAMKALKESGPNADPKAAIRKIIPFNVASVIVAVAGIAIVVASAIA